jgi:YVTN family beta-propeller protein
MRSGVAGTLTLALALAAGITPARAEGLPPGFTPSVVGGIAMDFNPGGMAFSYADLTNYTHLYVTHRGTGADLSGSNVQLINTLTNTVITTIPVGNGAFDIAIDSSRNRAYVASSVAETVSVIDTAMNTVVDTIPLGAVPAGIDLGLDLTDAGGPPLLYVALTETDQVAVIDAATNTVTARVAVDDAPSDIAVVDGGTELYLTHDTTTTVSVIDTATLTTTARIPAGADPSSLAVGHGDLNHVYVSNTDPSAASLAVIDSGTQTLTTQIPVGQLPQQPVANGLGTLVLVPAMTGAEVNIIDTATSTVVTTIPYDAPGDAPKSITVNPTGTLAYVSGTNEGISIIPLSPFKDVPVSNRFDTEINWMSQQRISTGWLDFDGTRIYRPLQHVARDAMAAFLYRMAGSPAYTPPAVSPFPDVSTDELYYKEIAWLTEEGIATGWTWPDGTRTFRPYGSVDRDAMAAFLYRMAGSPAFTPPAVSPFRDVATDNMFYKEISWLAAQGISTGWLENDGTHTFRPYDWVNRETMAAFIYRYSNTVVAPAPPQ